MKPIETQRMVTVFACGDCEKEHGDAARAEQCCACTNCGGPTTETDKHVARGGSKVSYYRSDLLCEWCRVRKDVKVHQDHVRRREHGVTYAKNTLANAETELKREQAALDALIAKRDALPPKPRQKKEDAA